MSTISKKKQGGIYVLVFITALVISHQRTISPPPPDGFQSLWPLPSRKSYTPDPRLQQKRLRRRYWNGLDKGKWNHAEGIGRGRGCVVPTSSEIKQDAVPHLRPGEGSVLDPWHPPHLPRPPPPHLQRLASRTQLFRPCVIPTSRWARPEAAPRASGAKVKPPPRHLRPAGREAARPAATLAQPLGTSPPGPTWGPGPPRLGRAQLRPGPSERRRRRALPDSDPPAFTCIHVPEPPASRPVPALPAASSQALRTRCGFSGGDAGSARREATGAKPRGKRSSCACSPDPAASDVAPRRSPAAASGPARPTSAGSHPSRAWAAPGFDPAQADKRRGPDGTVGKFFSLAIPLPEPQKLSLWSPLSSLGLFWS